MTTTDLDGSKVDLLRTPRWRGGSCDEPGA
jgi:hypothetical protein